MSAQVASFVEESCWNKDEFRSVRKAVTFRLVTVGKIGGRRIDLEFESDFGVFYDPEDSLLIDALREADPLVDWGQYVFWKRMDRSGIQVINPANEKPIAWITVRKRMGGDVSGETDWTNVVSLIPREKK